MLGAPGLRNRARRWCNRAHGRVGHNDPQPAGLAEALLATSCDGGIASDRAVTAFTRHWIDRLKASVCVEMHPNVRRGHVRLAQDAWHDVVVLKFVH
jgi:hypothetical protein